MALLNLFWKEIPIIVFQKMNKLIEPPEINYYTENPSKIEEQLQIGAKKASEVANKILKKTKEKLGY